MRWAALVLVALALSGCETTQEKSAKLERQADRSPGHGQRTQKGLSIASSSRDVRVVATTVIHSSEGNAAAVTLRNTSAKTLASVPVAITVKDANGKSLYTNAAPGLTHSLTSVALLAPHGELTWVDDQVEASGTPASVSAEVGEAPPVASRVPQIVVQGAHQFDDPTSGVGAEGTIVNRSTVAQRELVVYATVTRSGQVVAAGRAVLPSLAAGASSRFQVFFIGDPHGGKLTLAAPPSTLG